MGMGAAPAHGVVISWDNLKKLCPKEADAFYSACDGDLDGVAQAWQYSQQDDYFEEDDSKEAHLSQCWEKLRDAFIEKSKLNLSIDSGTLLGRHFVEESKLDISIEFYDADKGDQYDSLEHGAFFLVHGVYMRTPAAEALGNILEDASWTIYG